MPSFSDFDFSDDLLDGLDAMGFVTPTPVQEQAIPIVLGKKDLIACAQTGTGKTAAFLLPVLEMISRTPADNSINALIIVPTRELALQIDQQVEGLGYFTGVNSLPVYGGGTGMSWEQQKKALVTGVDLVIATPGRLISHLNLGYVKFDKVQHLILDEADRMLDMGFFDDLMKIIKYLPKERQTLMFSATMPPKIRKLSSSMLQNPEQISLAISKPAEGVLQVAYMVYDQHKVSLIRHLLSGKTKYPSIIVFSSTKKNVREIHRALKQKGLQVGAISSDLEQKEREEVLREFKNKKLQILVATDILSRGIDIKEISLVINYDIPMDAEDYVHRIGRTARAQSTGVAITFINEKDQQRFGKIEQLIEMEVQKVDTPEDIGKSPKYQPNRRNHGGKKYYRKKGNFKNRGPRNKR